MNPEITVIVLTYNQEMSIARTLDSIIGQKDSPTYEILIGEDCSTDRTRNICEEYSRTYPEIIRLMPESKNKGMMRNYFDCFHMARGHFIADCSGDDYWVDELKLRKEYNILQRDESINILFSGIKGLPTKENMRLKGRSLLEKYLDSTGIPPVVLSASMYRKKIVSEMMTFDNFLRYYSEDVPIISHLLSSGDAFSLKGETLFYDRTTESLSRPKKETERISNALKALEMRLILAEKYQVERSKLKNFVDESLSYISSLLLCYPGSEQIKEFDRIVSEKRINLTKKARIYRAIMNLRPAWKIAAYIRNIFLPSYLN